MNDMSFGLVDNFVNFENGSDAFQSGMEFGRIVSNIQGVVQVIAGAATFAFFMSTIPPTGGLTVACGATTVGLCLPFGGIVLTLEAVGALAGLGLATHGGVLLANNANNSLQIRGNGGGSSDVTKTYGTNTGDTQKNADILRANMGVGKTPGIQAHHIVPSTHSEAQKAREILESWGIDINQADNGVLLPKGIHDGLANDHTYLYACCSK